MAAFSSFRLREIEVECLPGDIPEHLTVDVSNLQIGDHVTVADLVYDRDKVKLLVDEIRSSRACSLREWLRRSRLPAG